MPPLVQTVTAGFHVAVAERGAEPVVVPAWRQLGCSDERALQPRVALFGYLTHRQPIRAATYHLFVNDNVLYLDQKTTARKMLMRSNSEFCELGVDVSAIITK
jgi:hypothetical protein